MAITEQQMKAVDEASAKLWELWNKRCCQVKAELTGKTEKHKVQQLDAMWRAAFGSDLATDAMGEEGRALFMERVKTTASSVLCSVKTELGVP